MNAILLFVAIGVSQAAALPASLSHDETRTWMAIGRQCQAPLVRIPSRDGRFELFVESPAARAAVVAAAAMLNHQRLDAQRVVTALRSGYRVWVNYLDGWRAVPIERLIVRTGRGPDLVPAAPRDERLFLGIAPSHGIIEGVRARFPQFEFPDLPRQDYTIVLTTHAGIQRYQVTQQDRTGLIRVCN